MSISLEGFDNKNLFHTADLALAAAISLYYPLEQIEKTNPKKAEFIFLRSGTEFDQLLENYWRGELRVNPISYFNQLKNLKARLYGS